MTTYYAVAFGFYSPRANGTTTVSQHVFSVSGRAPLTTAEAVARGRAAVEAEWDAAKNGPRAEYSDPAWSLASWVMSIDVPNRKGA